MSARNRLLAGERIRPTGIRLAPSGPAESRIQPSASETARAIATLPVVGYLPGYEPTTAPSPAPIVPPRIRRGKRSAGRRRKTRKTRKARTH